MSMILENKKCKGGVRARIQRYMEDPEFQKHAKGIDWKLDELFEVTLRLFERKLNILHFYMG